MVNTAHAGRRDPDLWDRLINDRFGGIQPILSPEESVVAARKLYRHAMGKAFPGRVEATAGNRYTWVRRGVLYVNPDKREAHTRGLRSLIHDISHYCHRRLHPMESAHSRRQALLEARLVKFAMNRKWHEGTLKKVVPEPTAPKPKVDTVVRRYRAVVARRDKWTREFERAKRLLEKATRDVRQYEKRHGARLEGARE